MLINPVSEADWPKARKELPRRVGKCVFGRVLLNHEGRVIAYRTPFEEPTPGSLPEGWGRIESRTPIYAKGRSPLTSASAHLTCLVWLWAWKLRPVPGEAHRRPISFGSWDRLLLILPYGLWTCADGREVLFNRRYQPLWQRRPGESATEADHSEWVEYRSQEWFYTDGTSPPIWGSTHAACRQVLKVWQVPEVDERVLVERMRKAPRCRPQVAA